MAGIGLRDVSKRYGSVPVIQGASLDIADGEFVVFVGPSGCGKSTLLRMIAGLEDISGGEVAIDGRVVNAVPARDRGVAMVFQNYALYPHMTVAENMSFGLSNIGTPRSEIDRRVGEAAEILQITTLLGRRPKDMSGGQRQRVAIGRAIVRKPKVFLFDEPLSNLDAALRVQMRTELAKLHHAIGATMIYVTHDQTEAMTMADRIVVLRDGRVEQVGRPLDLYRRPQNAFVAGFLGSPHERASRYGERRRRFARDPEALGIRPACRGRRRRGMGPQAGRHDPREDLRRRTPGRHDIPSDGRRARLRPDRNRPARRPDRNGREGGIVHRPTVSHRDCGLPVPIRREF